MVRRFEYKLFDKSTYGEAVKDLRPRPQEKKMVTLCISAVITCLLNVLCVCVIIPQSHPKHAHGPDFQTQACWTSLSCEFCSVRLSSDALRVPLPLCICWCLPSLQHYRLPERQGMFNMWFSVMPLLLQSDGDCSLTLVPFIRTGGPGLINVLGRDCTQR